jgi:hypothetical protein
MSDTQTTPAPLPPLHPAAIPVRGLQRRAAIAAAVGFSGLATFQAALALGAPLGGAAWGGGAANLSLGLRVASGVAVGVWLFASALVLRRAGMRTVPLPQAITRWGVWILVGLLALAAIMNFASSSVWERAIWGPFCLIMFGLCLIVARGSASRS